jgi:aspartyl-tRNA(Asn)/glutamyl-tRNA(Gln) amidotransferase subunit B
MQDISPIGRHAAKRTALVADSTPDTARSDGVRVAVGLEVHAQLATASKMFCGCDADYSGAEPNTHVCPICLGMPGVLPSMNLRAVEYTLMTGLALGCQISERSQFERKNYHYPDLPKGYQISQYELPLCREGSLEIEGDDGQPHTVGIERVHLEEDTAKLIHAGEHSLVDVNRAGVPLMEIVSHPDMRSADEARRFLVKLRHVLRWIGVSQADMEAGQLRADVNVSVVLATSSMADTGRGVKVEIKNLNSFRSVHQAIRHEIERLTGRLKAGEHIAQETRGWLEVEGRTVSQRTKEYAHDYRYFPEPDLPPLLVGREWLERLKAELPELPDARQVRFSRSYGLDHKTAVLMTVDRATADYFEAAVRVYLTDLDGRRAAAVAHWMSDLFGLLGAAGHDMASVPLPPQHLAELVSLVDRRMVTQATAKKVLAEMVASAESPHSIIQRKGLGLISDDARLQSIAEAVLTDNPRAVADFKRGKQAAIGFLLGQLMQRTAGQADPAVATRVLRDLLNRTQPE